MFEFLSKLPLEKLTEYGVITVITIIVLYSILKKYLNYKVTEIEKNTETKLAELRGRFASDQLRINNELQQIRQDVTQIQGNRISASELSIPETTQVIDNEITDGSRVTVQRNSNA